MLFRSENHSSNKNRSSSDRCDSTEETFLSGSYRSDEDLYNLPSMSQSMPEPTLKSLIKHDADQG